MKKIISVILAIALLVTFIPMAPQRAEAASDPARNFDFPNEQYNLNDAARIVNTERVTLQGTVHNVIGRTISYDVVQIYKKPSAANANQYEEVIIDSREGQTGNITLGNGTSSITVSDIQLFPGLNRITLKGTQGTANVESSIYIEYRNSPMLYNLAVNLNGKQFNVQDDETTVVYSDESNGKAFADIGITGNAPNAQKVSVTVNNKSWDYTVRSTDNWKFTASPIRINKGKNIVNIKVYNNNQVTETTRQVAFFNGEVTFYDVKVKGGTTSGDLATSPDISVAAGGQVSVEGSVIVPVLYIPKNDTATPPIPEKYQPSVFNDVYLSYKVTNTLKGNLDLVGSFPTLDPTLTFITLPFTKVLGNANSTDLEFDKTINIQFSGMNYRKSPTAGTDYSAPMSFTLRNAGQPYIYAVNYLPGYTPITDNAERTARLEPMQGTNMISANVSTTPIGIEVLVGNSNGSAAQIVDMYDSQGKKVDSSKYLSSTITTTKKLYKDITVNGVTQTFERVFIELSKLPTAGQQSFDVKVGSSIKRVPFTFVYGPYVKYESVFDGKIIEYDTTQPDADQYLLGELSNFKGELFNITNVDEIKYDSTSGRQTVFLYINNTLVDLVQDGASVTKFVLKDPSTAFKALYRTGENTIKFVFKTPKNTYEQQIKINLVPTNLPVIPVKGSAGVFPYSINYSTPKPNDPNFVLKGSVYTTKESQMNVYGTFDFIDLGINSAAVVSKLGQSGLVKDNYKIKITSPDSKDPIYWSLANEFTGSDGVVFNQGQNVDKLQVTYDYESQTFAFYMKDQKLPADGSPKVYNIYVYNGGESGPYASYRLEIQPIAIPYTIERPKLEKRIVNQNFVEVIISSPGAEKVTIQKTEAEKFLYDPSNGNEPNSSYDAFRAMVYDLKPNKDNKIDLIITRGKEVTKDSFIVKYVPATIPGNQIMEVLKSSHKLFEGKLNLAFPKGTTLVRTDYNTNENYKGQVYSGNRVLFSIANPEDGVVDRHDFERLPANYSLAQISGSQVYKGNFPSQFVKASPVYWLDPGMADDENSKDLYDPVMHGFDPFPLPNTELPFFNNRPADRELVPSKSGTLTLSYDLKMTQDAGRLVTVFRFDPVLKQWENIGGVVDAKKHTIKVPFNRFGYYVVAKLGYSFNDVVLHPYGREAIETIYAKGVMNPIDPSGMFGADEYLTRAEFTRMLVKALEVPLNYEGLPRHFSDISYSLTNVSTEALWDFRYIETAARLGIVRGIQPNVFGPDNHILRQDAAVMIAKALNMKLDTDPVKVKAAVNKAFKDAGKIDYYAQPAIAAIAKKGFINGIAIDPTDPKKGYNFQPDSRLLRGDAAIIISRVMTDLKKLPKIYAN